MSDAFRRRAVARRCPIAWLALFFLVPFLIVLQDQPRPSSAIGIPPYTAPLDRGDGGRSFACNLAQLSVPASATAFTCAAYLNAAQVRRRRRRSICLLLGYPMAYGIARAPRAGASSLLLLVILPFWTSFLIRVYAWIGLLKGNGVINNLLLAAGLIHEPLPLLNNAFAVYARHRLLLSAVHGAAALRASWRSSTRRCSRRRPISAAGRGSAFSRVTLAAVAAGHRRRLRCWSSFRRSASSSSPICSAAPTR